MPPEFRNKPENDSSSVEVPAEDWSMFLDAFSRQHEGWLVTIAISTPESSQVEAYARRLRGVSVDHLRGRHTAYIETGDEQDSVLTHAVSGVARMVFLRSKSGAHRGLEIISADGTKTRMIFRSAILPDMVSGLGAA